tara:strand:+ start:1287 stop:2030 length:744 start_codon:yes stop_codon:yes gene_type:complete
MKKLLTTMIILFYSTFAYGIDLIVPASSGGTYHKFATIIQKDLESKGFDVNLVVSGNCVIGKKQWQDSKSAIMINSEATNAVKECTVDITKENYVHNFFTAGWVIVSKTNTLGEKMGVVSYMKHTVADLDVKPVPYKNTTEVKAAFLAGEIDSGFLTTGRASSIEDKVELINTMSDDKGEFADWSNNDLTLNYYIIAKNVGDEILDAVRSNSKMQSIAEKKGMMPITYENKLTQIEYLKRNQEKWSK